MQKQPVPVGVELAKLIREWYLLTSSGKAAEAQEHANSLLESVDFSLTPVDRSAGEKPPKLEPRTFTHVDDFISALMAKEARIYFVIGPSGSGKSALVTMLPRVIPRCYAFDLDEFGYRNMFEWTLETLTLRLAVEEALRSSDVVFLIGTAMNVSEAIGFCCTLADTRVALLWPATEVVLNAHMRRIAHSKAVHPDQLRKLILLATDPRGMAKAVTATALSVARTLYPTVIKLSAIRYGYIHEMAKLAQSTPGRTAVRNSEYTKRLGRLWKYPCIRPSNYVGPVITWRPQPCAIASDTYDDPRRKEKRELILPAWCLGAPKDTVWPGVNIGAAVRRFILDDLRPIVRCNAKLALAAKIELYPTTVYVEEVEEASDTHVELQFEGFSPRLDDLIQTAIQLSVDNDLTDPIKFKEPVAL